MTIFSDDNTDSTTSDSEYDSECDSDGDLRIEDHVDAPDGVDLNGDGDMERDCKDEEDEEEEDDKEEEEVVDEDEDVDNGKEPRTIGHGEMLNSSADDADTMVDCQPTMLSNQGQEMCKHTPRQQPLAPAPLPHTPEPHPRPQTPKTNTLSGPEFLGLGMLHKLRPAAPTLQEAEAAGNISDVDVQQHLLGKAADGDSLPDVSLPDGPLRDVPRPTVPPPEARLDRLVGEE
jgi:hypothetical protein